ncbi:Membrane carboxypeptidase (penicillin-binding protein) [Sinosporangium album]|uniref:Membrane carboxypeptidase (Penicillin-binding protein) n=1 Tax=Sinosporangium album TaxID=504805 RepID=A0A1G7U2I3_9ACTN|nr:Membrane carboxypeptidase (penicillin-binding protein) [Sinosporangium album]
MALPAVGGAGIAVKSATEDLRLQPEELEEPPLPQVTEILDVNGKKFAQFYYENRESVSLDQVAPIMQQAIIAIEDFRFYEHGAIDLEGTLRALVKNLTSGGITEGGSSITQQYVKQVLVNAAENKEDQDAAVEASLTRKLNELRHAMAIEQKYTKDQILERYLNIAYFGAGAHGIQAASKRFFDKPASKLELHEAATLAAAVQNPSSTDPNVSKAQRKRLQDRRNLVLDRMAELKKISKEEAEAAKKRKLGWKDTEMPGGCEQSKYAYFCMYTRYEILNNRQFGKTPEERERRLVRGGLTIKTTLDPKMQKAAEKAIRKYAYPSDKPVVSEAMIVPGTGEIRAMAASRTYGNKGKKNEMGYNVVADEAHGGAIGFQTGSTAKVYTLVAALEKGMKLSDGFSSGNVYYAPSASAFRDCKNNLVGIPGHPVRNSSEGGGGFQNLQTGTWNSVNTFFMQLQQRVGLCDTVKTAEKLGMKRANGEKLEQVETFTLGVNESDPVTVANSYATIAARGKYCEPMAITEIRERDGKTKTYKPKCKEVLDPEVADAANHILSGVFTKGTMRDKGNIGRDAAGKTGTTDDYTAAWFAGYTPDLAAAVSIGDTRGAFTHDLTNVTIGGTSYTHMYGSSIAGPVWVESMRAALAGTRATSFVPVNMARFGGCASSCAPKPVKKEPRNGGDGDIDTGGGDGDGGDADSQGENGADRRFDRNFGDERPITPVE